MRVGRRPVIGVLTPYTSGYYYGAIVSGIQRVACARGAIVVAVQTTGMDLAWPDEPGDQYLGMGAVDGWIAVNEFASAASARASSRSSTCTSGRSRSPVVRYFPTTTPA